MCKVVVQAYVSVASSATMGIALSWLMALSRNETSMRFHRRDFSLRPSDLFPDTEPGENRIENILDPDMTGDPAQRSHCQPQILTA
jgi:hypothetical protein